MKQIISGFATTNESTQTTLGGFAAMALLLIGFYLPTSIGATYSKGLYGVSFLLCFVIFGVLMFRGGNIASFGECLLAGLIVPLLLVFTGLSPLHDAAYGAVIVYGLLSAMLMLNLREVPLPPWGQRVLSMVNLINFVLCIGVLLGVQVIDQLIIQIYTVSKDYSDLVPNMLLFRKPVLSFGTHSLAGFFFYLFFHINWESYLAFRKKKFLFFALGYLGLTASLLSVTGLILATIGLGQVLYRLWKITRKRWLWGLAAASMVCLAFAFPPSRASVQNLADSGQFVTAILTSTGGGFGGRLSPGGTLYGNIQYIRLHPFRPVGVTNSATLLFVDSGWVEYMLRGSIPLVVLIYGCFYLFLKRSLMSRKDRWWLFAVILAFETGFTSLVYQRMSFLLPFVIIYLNSVRRTQALQASSLTTSAA